VEITIVSVGKLRPYYRQAVDDYARRLKRYTGVREEEVREASRAPQCRSAARGRGSAAGDQDC